MATKKIPIGIDLGTTFSCIAYIDNNKNVEIIENTNTRARVTPSVCTFNETDIRVGRPSRASENAIYEVKRLIGRKFNHSQVQSDIKNLTFKVTEKNNKPQINVNFRNQKQFYYPEQISAMVLRELKKIAETHLGEKVKAVITVPAYFNDEQKQATLDAAKIAGLEVLKIIPEPTAAAIAYGFHRKLIKKSKILIFDLGGGTFDVSIMEIDDGEFRVLGVDGDIHLGGTDFDNRLVDHFLQIVKDKYHVDLRDRKKATLRLKKKCEEIKRELSLVNETNIEIDALIGEQDFDYRFTRKEFEEINQDLFERTIEIVGSALKRANLHKQDIDDVVLVGGSSRIPKVKKLLQSFFGGKQLRQDINPDEVVAFGAAIQARLLCGDSLDGRVRKIIDVIPKSLGIQVSDGSMDVFFPRNSSIPNKFTKIYTNSVDNQLGALFLIFEGEDKIAANNNLLGEFRLENIKSCPKHMAKFDTIFKIDENGLLSVTAKDLDTLSSNQISISFQKGSLSEVSISEMTNQMDKLFS